MTISAGTKVVPYAILAPIGSGGMGEAYCARDTKLKRDVALIVLREAFVLDRNAWPASNAKPKFWLRSITPTSRKPSS